MKNQPVKWTEKFYKVIEIENKIPFNSVRFWDVTTEKTAGQPEEQGVFPTVVQDGQDVSGPDEVVSRDGQR